MPVKKVDGKYQYGKTGKKYKKKADAVRQGQAIHASKNKRTYQPRGR